MSFLHLTEERTAIRKYSSATTGEKSIVRVEIEVTDPYYLGELLRQLGTAQKELAAARKPKKAKAEKPRQIEHRQMLALPYYGDDR